MGVGTGKEYIFLPICFLSVVMLLPMLAGLAIGTSFSFKTSPVLSSIIFIFLSHYVPAFID